MVRAVTIVCLILSLAGCKLGSGPMSEEGAPTRVSTASTDPRVAKEVFGHIPTPTTGDSQSVGSYARGCQAGAVALPETGATWQAMRLSRNRNWGQPRLVAFLTDLSAFAATQPGWSGLYLGDMSQPRGGPMLTGHASHQIGLDADIWLLPADRLNLSASERENISSARMDHTDGAYVNDNWTPAHEAIIRRAAEDPRVARIFIFPGAKVEMCRNATGDRTWLNKVRPWFGHNYHFHVRLNCDPSDPACEPQSPPPDGDGCADAEQWVRDILNPPPPPANPAPARGPLTMGELPDMCSAVANE